MTEAAKDFLRLLDWVESHRESAILIADGRGEFNAKPYRERDVGVDLRVMGGF